MSSQSDLLNITARMNAELAGLHGSALNMRLQRAELIRQFVSTVLVCMSHSSADQAALRAESGSLLVSVEKGGQSVFAANLIRDWFAHIHAWLRDRQAFDSEMVAAKPKIAGVQQLHFSCILKAGRQKFRFVVESSSTLSAKDSLLITALQSIDSAEFEALSGVMEYSRPAFQKLVEAGSGLLLLMIDDSTTDRALAYARTLFGATYIGSIADSESRETAMANASASKLILAQKSWDPLEGAFESCSLLGQAWPDVIGMITVRFVRGVCPSCARKTAADRAISNMLPEGLQPLPGYEFLVGRGCDSCNFSGRLGYVPLLSVIEIDDHLKAQIPSVKQDRLDLYRYVYERGAKPLLEDGIRKVIAGATTISMVLEVIKVVPQGYSSLVAQDGPFALQHERKPLARGTLATSQAPDVLRGIDVWSNSGAAEASKPKLPQRPVVLVVEDDADQRAILEMVLKSANFEVVTAANGFEGIDKLSKRDTHLIISDLMMPQMDGREFVSRVKLDRRYRSIPLMVLTVISDPDKEYDLLDLGADDYCEKTVQRKILLKRIETLLRRSYEV